MTTKKSMWILFGILVISAWVLGSVMPGHAETMKCRTAGVVPGKSSQAIGYTIFTFEDGSTFVQRFQRLQGSDKTLPAQVASELIKGTGRFEGIKGSASGTGKRPPEVKGEAKKYFSDMTFTYTLPTK